MKDHFVAFKRKGEQPYSWHCTREQQDAMLDQISKYSQMIDLRDALGQVFTFKDFTGAGKLPKSQIKPEFIPLEEPKITEEEKQKRKKTIKKFEKLWAKKFDFFKKD